MYRSSISWEIIDALVAQWTTALDGIQVVDGYGDPNEPGKFLMVGVEDFLADGPARAVTTDQDWAWATTTVRREEGNVNCLAWARIGDTTAEAPQVVRARVRDICDRAADYLRNNYTLQGLDGLLHVSFRMTSADQDIDADGAWALAFFQVGFKAQI